MVGMRLPAVWAGVAALAAAVAGALAWPGLDPSGLPLAFVEGLGTSATVLYVLFGGLLLYNLLSAGGAIGDVSRFLGRLEPEKDALAIGVVVGVAPFFESVTGFGVAVVISAPIFLAAGFSPLRAAVLSSWGQCAVPWGALGVGTVIGADLSAMSFGALSDWSALLSLPLFPVYAVAAAALAGVGGFGAWGGAAGGGGDGGAGVVRVFRRVCVGQPAGFGRGGGGGVPGYRGVRGGGGRRGGGGGGGDVRPQPRGYIARAVAASWARPGRVCRARGSRKTCCSRPLPPRQRRAASGAPSWYRRQ